MLMSLFLDNPCLSGYHTRAQSLYLMHRLEGCVYLPSIRHPFMEMAEKCHPFIEAGCSSLVRLWKRYEMQAVVTESVRQP